jgi:hypothetical protein
LVGMLGTGRCLKNVFKQSFGKGQDVIISRTRWLDDPPGRLSLLREPSKGRPDPYPPSPKKKKKKKKKGKQGF